MQTSKKMERKFKRLFGAALGKYRLSRHIELRVLSQKAPILYPKINLTELGENKGRNCYKCPLEYFDKDVQIILTDKKIKI